MIEPDLMGNHEPSSPILVTDEGHTGILFLYEHRTRIVLRFLRFLAFISHKPVEGLVRL